MDAGPLQCFAEVVTSSEGGSYQSQAFVWTKSGKTGGGLWKCLKLYQNKRIRSFWLVRLFGRRNVLPLEPFALGKVGTFWCTILTSTMQVGCPYPTKFAGHMSHRLSLFAAYKKNTLIVIHAWDPLPIILLPQRCADLADWTLRPS